MDALAAVVTRLRDLISRLRAASGESTPQPAALRIAARPAAPALGDSGRTDRIWRAYLNTAAPLAIVILAVGGLRLAILLAEAARSPGAIGIDYTTVMGAARRWLAGSSPYLARQLAGPYEQLGANVADSGEMLYPPIALPFFAVFSALPGLFWWAIPALLSALEHGAQTPPGGRGRSSRFAWCWVRASHS